MPTTAENDASSISSHGESTCGNITSIAILITFAARKQRHYCSSDTYCNDFCSSNRHKYGGGTTAVTAAAKQTATEIASANISV